MGGEIHVRAGQVVYSDGRGWLSINVQDFHSLWAIFLVRPDLVVAIKIVFFNWNSLRIQVLYNCNPQRFISEEFF